MRRRQLAILSGVGLLLTAQAVLAQGFMVRPMSVNITGQPGQALQTHVGVTNTRADGPQTLRARLQLLGQTPTGAWRMVDPNDAEGAKSVGRSCYDWTTLANDSVTVQPVKEEKFAVTVRIPVRASGAYAVALIVASQPPPNRGAIGIVFQFLIPVIVRVQGPTARQAITIGEPLLTDVPATDKAPATTLFAVGINNTGETYETVGASANVLMESKGKWRRVSGIQVPDHGLLPGLAIQAPASLGKRLPAGRYRVQGALRVNGALKERFDRVIEFAGDPSVKDVPFDVDLLLQPASLAVVSQPGARRSAMLTVENPSPETVHVRCGAGIPKSLNGVALGDLVGEKFSCVPWLTVTPNDFQLASGGKRTVRVDVAWPADETALPVHYANVVVLAGYDTGGTAGQFVVPLSVRGADANPTPKAAADGLDISAAEANKCSVNARFFNVGLAEWSATAEITLGPVGANAVATCDGEVDVPLVLPLGLVRVSGVLDLSKVPPGTYALTAKINLGGISFDQSLPVRVDLKDKVKVATVIEQKKPAAPAPAPGGAKDGK